MTGTAWSAVQVAVLRLGGLTFAAGRSLRLGGLPLGLAHNIRLVRPVKKGQSLSWADVAIDTNTAAYKLRNEMEALFAPAVQAEAA